MADRSLAQQIRDLLQRDRPLVMGGVYDGLSTRIAHRAGFEVLFMGGFSVAATLLGEPDFGYLTQTEIADTARRVCRLTDRPLLVDADTGYGNALNVIRTVELFQTRSLFRKLDGPQFGGRSSSEALRLHAPPRAGTDFVLLYSTSATDGLPLDTRRFPLDLTPLLLWSVAHPVTGTLDGNGEAVVPVHLPPGVVGGVRIDACWLGLDPGFPSGIRVISNALSVPIQ